MSAPTESDDRGGVGRPKALKFAKLMFWIAGAVGVIAIVLLYLRASNTRVVAPKEHSVSFAEQAEYFDSNGVQIRYVMRGHGEPVILLHGFVFSSKSNWIDGGVFAALSQDYCVIAMDLRGHGGSGKPHDAESYGLEMVNDVLRLMDHLKIERAHVIGYSLGGILALKLIEVAPERLRSLVLGGAGWVRDDQQWKNLAEMLEKIRPGESISSHFWPDQRQRPPQEIQQIVDNNDAAALAAVSRGMLNVAVAEEALRSNLVPILGIFGAADSHQSEGAAMNGVARGFTMQVVPGLDHNSLAGSEEFRLAARKFIADAVVR
jgi:pimeloyl-ACP methyl ester carboxylesterase